MRDNSESIIYLVRHGVTQSNKRKIYAGWSEEDLVKEGVIQAEKLGRKLKGMRISTIYTSPIRRTLQTAEILNKYIKCELKIDPDLKEIKMGPWEGLSEEEVAVKYPSEYKIWLNKPAELNIKGRETLNEVQCRAVRAVNKILNDNFDKIAVVVTHVAIIRCLLLYLKCLSLNLYKTIDIPNLSIHQLKFKSEYKVNICYAIESLFL